MVEEERCYICNRTVDECRGRLRESIIESYDRMIKSVAGDYLPYEGRNHEDSIRKHAKAYSEYQDWDKDQEKKKNQLMELKKEIERLEFSRKNTPSPGDPLSFYSLVSKLDDRFISKYGNWNREKYFAAIDIKYPFEKGDEELLKTYFTEYSSIAPEATLADVKKSMEDNASNIREEFSNLETELAAKPPDLNVLKENFADDVLERIKIKTLDTSYNIPIPICSVCNDICSKIALDLIGRYS